MVVLGCPNPHTGGMKQTTPLQRADRVAVRTMTYGETRYYSVYADVFGPYIRCGKRGTVKEYLIARTAIVEGLYVYSSAWKGSDEWLASGSYDWQRMEA